MKRQHTKVYLTVPALCLLLTLTLIVSHRGLPLEPRPPKLDRLTEAAGSGTSEVEALLLAEEETALLTVVKDTLNEMRIGWKVSDRLEEAELDSLNFVLVCSQNPETLFGENAVHLIEWVERGGSLALMTAQATDGWIRIAGHKLGMMDSTSEYYNYHALRVDPKAMALFSDVTFDEGMDDYTLPIRIEPDCEVLIRTADERAIPLMWTREIGKGRAVVCNHTLIAGKDSRGLAAMTIAAARDVLVYPIINAGMVFIDDFPAPQPEGYDKLIQQQFGMSIQEFYRNHWWPDMKTFARKYGVRYTGVLVETYNKTMTPPFAPDTEDNALIRYYASELVHMGGEVGLHGYNHQPLCLDGWHYAKEDYDTWDSMENMVLAVKELLRYGRLFLPESSFTCYVPPSNYLSPEGQQVLVETVPSLLTISGVYLPEDGIDALVQEYHENPDGTVPVPRISSGFSMDHYQKMVAAEELYLHGVFSHFIHPDDVLDEERGALLGWKTMAEGFDDALEQVTGTYPALRWCTATEAAAAVQRFDRLGVTRKWEGNRLTLTLTGFVDEAWLCLNAKEAPAQVEGAEVYPAGNGLWLKALQDTVTLDWEKVEP
ncbi:MAG: DUF2194 domain-containing protein [Clostridiales bacterium]|nr:DUF2194 domain-containing protein [Clostridiales bacterium]